MLEGEEKIIEAARRGDSGSFDELYSHYVPPIYRFIYMKVTHREEAEDLTHDVFMSAWQNLHRYRIEGFPFSSWLYQIARNRVIDYYRLKRTAVSLDDAKARLVKAESFVEEGIDRELSVDRVKRTLENLTNDQQDVIIMKFIEDLSNTEIAAALEKSEGAIRLIQHRALNELKRLISKS